MDSTDPDKGQQRPSMTTATVMRPSTDAARSKPNESTSQR